MGKTLRARLSDREFSHADRMLLFALDQWAESIFGLIRCRRRGHYAYEDYYEGRASGIEMTLAITGWISYEHHLAMQAIREKLVRSDP